MNSFISVATVSAPVILLDQLTKCLARQSLVIGDSHPVIPGVFHLTLVLNQGAAFGLLQGAQGLFILFSVISIVLLVLLLNRYPLVMGIFALDARHSVVRFCLGLVLGGAFGNLIDRLRFGHVVDFLDFRVWPVFNLADSAVTVGGIVLVYKMFNKPPVH